MFYVDICRKCLKPEVRPEYSDYKSTSGPPSVLNKVSLDGGTFIVKLCGDCRENTTISELEKMKSDDWFGDFDVSVTVARSGPAPARKVAVRLIKDRPRKRGRRA